MIASRIPTNERLLFSRDEAAQLLSVSPRTVTYAIDANRLSVTRIGRRTLISRGELERFAKIDQPNFRIAA
ncbi:MAG: Helix-turn-helix domain [Acidobacteriaceae bacterium]|nr:Helix-turn-helix domain [Acidobacteriaceae bacterium]